MAMTVSAQRRRLSRRRRNLVRRAAARAIMRSALNRDVLVPRPAGRFLFGRLINRDDEKLQILPLGSRRPPAGRRQSAMARRRDQAGAELSESPRKQSPTRYSLANLCAGGR